MVYILDQVRALEEEMLLRIKHQGLAVKPNILVVSGSEAHGEISLLDVDNFTYRNVCFILPYAVPLMQVTRLIPDAKHTKCNQELEPIVDTKHSYILRVPFKTPKGVILRQWVSRFDVYPYLERFAQANILDLIASSVAFSSYDCWCLIF